MTPDGVGIENPAFDVTPARYITAIITERGVLRGPLADSIAAMADTATEPELASRLTPGAPSSPAASSSVRVGILRQTKTPRSPSAVRE